MAFSSNFFLMCHDTEIEANFDLLIISTALSEKLWPININLDYVVINRDYFTNHNKNFSLLLIF